MPKHVLVALPLSDAQRSALQASVPEYEFIFAQTETVTLAQVLEADIIMGNVPVELICQNHHLEWFQSNFAGPDTYLVPGVLPEEECFTEESHWAGLLEYPQYSRPDEWHGRRVPDVLLSGHHENVAKWRKKESYKRTMLRRPDLWAQFDEKQLKTKSEKKVLAEAKAEAEAIRAAEVKKAEESDTETPVE